MPTRIPAFLVVLALVAAACSDTPTTPDTTSTPATNAPATTEAPLTSSAPETTAAAPSTSVAVEAGVPGYVTGAVVAAMTDTSMEGVTHDEVAEDILAACESAGDSPDGAAFVEDLVGIVAGRMFLYGEPADGEVSARYSQALGAAFYSVCPDDMGEALVEAGESIEPSEHPEQVESALEALALGLEDTPFEGMLQADWPADDVVPVLEEICRLADSRNSNVTIFEYVTDTTLERLDLDQGDLDLITVSLITVAVVFMCPWNSEAVLGP